MFGKVYGPYTLKTGHKYVHIVLHNDDGSVQKDFSISYNRYMNEVEQGLHQYHAPINTRQQYKINKEKQKENIQYNCSHCNREFSTNRNINNPLIFCSESCKNKYKRIIRRKQTIVYHNQIVVTINNKETDNHYFIIYDKNNKIREQCFIKANKTTLVVDEDSNGIVRYQLHYNKEDTVRIRAVPGYKKYFWITESGIIVSKRTKKILSQSLSQTGYWTHSSMIGGRKGRPVCFKIHRLVALAFIPNPESKPFINHINGIKTDNHWTNLEWCTAKENSIHAVATGLHKTQRGAINYWAKFTNVEAEEIRELAKTNSIRNIARSKNVCHSTIARIVSGKRYK